ncbi:MAG: glycosyltransferase family 39 protein [Candidatus Rokubacteria bacterium]|nr:glycosyltransferase family 39 protein [Candidatus Rokubacteria bacterium]
MTGIGRWPAAGLVVALLPVVSLLLVLDRAAMIDDALFLKAASQIFRDPARPFDFLVNWYGWEEPFWHVFKNPPGLSYWLAASDALFGEREAARHASMLPFTIAAVVAAAWLTRRFAGEWPWITAAWAASPAFLVSSATLMADVPALACSLWGLVFWIRGAGEDTTWSRRLGAGLAGLAVVVKYTALLGIATLLLYSLLVAGGARRRRQLADLWPAMLAPSAWSLLTLATHGRNHMIDALTVGGGGLDPNPGWFAHRAIALLTFIAGTSVFAVLAVVPAVQVRRRLTLAAVAAGVATAVALATPHVWSPRGLGGGAVPVAVVLATIGALVLLLAFREGLRSGEPESRFLVAWVALHLAYLWLWSWSVAARFVLPLMLPLVILLARSLGARADAAASRARAGLFGAAAGVALAVSVTLLLADSAVGDFYRRAIPIVVKAQAARERGRVHFVGAWGFQHYAERAGLTKLNRDAPVVARGDLVLQPYYAANRDVPAGLEDRLEEHGRLTGPRPPLDVHTMNINVAAGFYSSAYGPLPFTRARLPLEGILVWRVRK